MPKLSNAVRPPERALSRKGCAPIMLQTDPRSRRQPAWHRSHGYDLRRLPCVHHNRDCNAIHECVVQRFLKVTLFCIVLFSALAPVPGLAGDNPSDPPRLASAETHRFSLKFPWFGRTEAISSVIVAARVRGRITQIHPRDEGEVQQGDLLFEMGGREVKARHVNLTGQVEQARQALDAARQNLAIHRKMLGEKLSNRELVNTARQALAQVQSQFSAARQRLETFEAATCVRAPADGVFTARAVNPGQFVMPGTVLGRIVDPRFIRIRASMFPPSGMNLIGLTAIVRTGKGQEKQAIVSRRMPERTPEGGVQIWIEGQALKGLAPGTQVSGVIVKDHPALAVPARAIARDDQGRAYVFIKTAQGWRKQGVETGLHDQGRAEIISGLQAGEQIAVEDAYELLYRDFSKMYRAPD